MKAELYKEIHDKLNNLGAFGMLIHDSDNITQNDICNVLKHYPIATDGCEFTMWDFRMKDRLQNQSDMFGETFLELFDSKKKNEFPMNDKLYQDIIARMNELGAIRKDWTIGCEGFIFDTDWCDWEQTEKDYIDKDGERYMCQGEYDESGLCKFHDEDFPFTPIRTIIGHKPVFTDCISAMRNSVDEDLREDFEAEYHEAIMSIGSIWDYSKPYLQDQSDELGQKLLDLISLPHSNEH